MLLVVEPSAHPWPAWLLIVPEGGPSNSPDFSLNIAVEGSTQSDCFPYAGAELVEVNMSLCQRDFNGGCVWTVYGARGCSLPFLSRSVDKPQEGEEYGSGNPLVLQPTRPRDKSKSECS